MKPREVWIDVAKGGSILLVILNHVVVSALDAGLVGQSGPWGATYYVLYSGGLMATFFFLGGWGAAHRLNDTRATLRSIGRGAVWPYLLWGAIFLLGQTLAGGLRNQAGTVEIGWSLLWTPIAWLWFLWAIAVFHLAALLFRNRPGTMLCVSLALLPLTDWMRTVFARQLTLFFCFYALGVWIGPRALPRVPLAGPIAVLGAVALWRLDMIPLTAFGAPFALLWMLSTFQLSKRASGTAANVLSWLGRRSMAIYVSHFFFITATRILLDKGLGITSFAVHLPLGFAAGLAGSLALLAIAQRFGFAGLLGFGTQPQTRLPGFGHRPPAAAPAR